MLLDEVTFNEIRSLPDYLTYLCVYTSEIHTRATGSCFDKYTSYMEVIFISLFLQKELELKTLEEVFNYIKEVTGVEIADGWMSPAFMDMFYTYCEKNE